MNLEFLIGRGYQHAEQLQDGEASLDGYRSGPLVQFGVNGPLVPPSGAQEGAETIELYVFVRHRGDCVIQALMLENAPAAENGAAMGQKMFHLAFYTHAGREVIGFFDRQPSYAQIRAFAVVMFKVSEE